MNSDNNTSVPPVIPVSGDHESVDSHNKLNFDTLASDTIKAYYKTVQISDWGKCSEIVDVTKNRAVLVGDIDENTGDLLDNFIRFWNTYDDELNIAVEDRIPIKVFINSNGGDLDASFTSINAIQQSVTPVWTINSGKCYSGGFLIFLAGHKRIAYSLSSFMFHEGSCGISSDANKFRNWAAFYEKQCQQMGAWLLARTKITEDEYQKHVKDDWWFTADEAVMYGIADEIASLGWKNK